MVIFHSFLYVYQGVIVPNDLMASWVSPTKCGATRSAMNWWGIVCVFFNQLLSKNCLQSIQDWPWINDGAGFSREAKKKGIQLLHRPWWMQCSCLIDWFKGLWQKTLVSPSLPSNMVICLPTNPRHLILKNQLLLGAKPEFLFAPSGFLREYMFPKWFHGEFPYKVGLSLWK